MLLEDVFEFLTENGPIIASITAIAALTPPPLSMFPPQGVPQPGGPGTGGGSLPSSALSVRIT